MAQEENANTQAQPATPAPQPQAPAAQPSQPQTPAPQQPAPAQPAPAPQPAAPAPAQPVAQPAAKPAEAAPKAQPAASKASTCKCQDVKAEDWDKKKQKIDKMFYKAFSPRLLYYPFSFAIDVNRAVQGALKKGYKEVPSPMILDYNPKMFWSTVLVEVSGADSADPHVLSLVGREVYTKACKTSFRNMGKEIAELEKELGAKLKELFVWYTSCPACADKREVKYVLIAVL